MRWKLLGRLGAFVVGALAQGILGKFAVDSLDIVQNPDVRDVGVIIIWVLVITGGCWVLSRVLGTWNLKDATDPPDASHDAYDDKLFEKRAAAATGETPVGELIQDYVTATSYYDYSAVVSELMLAEVALLRRLAVRFAEQHVAPRTACENVLRVAGVSDPSLALARLEGRDLNQAVEHSQSISLTWSGNQIAVETFAELLKYNLALYAVYRRVALVIDKTIRWDGKPLVPSYVTL